jgi:hypothetical protein
MKRFLSLDWDAVAGITAAVAALVLHFLHIVKAGALLTMVLLLLGLRLVRDLRREAGASLQVGGLGLFFFTMWTRVRPTGSQQREARSERF